MKTWIEVSILKFMDAWILIYEEGYTSNRRKADIDFMRNTKLFDLNSSKKLLNLCSICLLVIFAFMLCACQGEASQNNEEGNSAISFEENADATDGALDTGADTAEDVSKADEENAEISDNAEELNIENAADSNAKTKKDTKTASNTNNMSLNLKGTQIVDSKGNPVQLKGVSTHGIGWFPQYVNYDAFKCMRDSWNVNCVRLAMYSDEGAGYCTGGDPDGLKSLVNKGVGYATDLGMYVIIDWHVLGEQDPNVHIEEAKEFFKEMSSKYADNDNVIYEICNEPNGSATWDNVKGYAEDVIDVIRQNDDNALIIVGTTTWSQDVDIAAEDPITDYDNIMYAIHFYAGTHKDDLRKKMTAALDAGLPLFCSEFGICDASGNGDIDPEEADKWIKAMDEAGMSYCIWNLSNKNESSSLIQSSCIKTEDWTYDELSDEAKWYLKVLDSPLAKEQGETSKSKEKESTSKSDTAENKKNSDKAKESDKVKESDIEKSKTGLGVEAKKVNSWDDGKNKFCQVNVKFFNKGKTVKDWEIVVDFHDDFSIDQKWNGNYKKSGRAVIITPVDYNKELKDGDEYEVGFIVKSSKEIVIENVSIN